jgi:hypothetical protein
MDLKGMGWNCIDCCNLVNNKNQRLAFVNVIIKVLSMYDRASFNQDFFLNNQKDAIIIRIYSVIKLYMFRASSLPIIRSFLLYIRHC